MILHCFHRVLCGTIATIAFCLYLKRVHQQSPGTCGVFIKNHAQLLFFKGTCESTFGRIPQRRVGIAFYTERDCLFTGLLMERLRPSRFSCSIAAISLLGMVLLVPSSPAQTGHTQSIRQSDSVWKKAEAARARLMAQPPADRTSAEYDKVMDLYREIYHSRPSDLKAPASIYAVAELLTEQGKTSGDSKALQSAIGQCEFLRSQYPTSSLRITALLAEGKIAQNDLKDNKLAREKYKAVVTTYPQSSSAAEARGALAAMANGPKDGTDAGIVVAKKRAPTQTAETPTTTAPTTAAPKLAAKKTSTADEMPAVEPEWSAGVQPSPVSKEEDEKRRGNPALVTGIRHWSTPTYTRVAIDLGSEVRYEAARVPNPDRIYFDLHGTKLQNDLVGKAFTVTDDGFLKKIRVAQFSGDRTRVVLDVNDVTEYSAFLLPNPYRLIIDIHGGSARKTVQTVKTAQTTLPESRPIVASVKAQPSATSTTGRGELRSTLPANLPSSLPPTAPSSLSANVPDGTKPTVAASAGSKVSVKATDRYGNESAQVAKLDSSTTENEREVQPVESVPSTIATQSKTGHEVASLSQQPDKQAGTSAPTSQPISVVSPSANGVDDAPKTRRGKNARPATPETLADVRVAEPTQDGQRSLVRALGLKIGRIVIDPGHGGHDVGTIGAGGIYEKDVVLDVGLRLGKLLHEKLGAEIIYTRSDDTFIPLETRTAIANKAQADLFISIHANSSSDTSARGVETYYLNFTTATDALEVAARENSVSDQSVFQLADLVKKITLKDKIEESREFAADVENSLYTGLQQGNVGLKNRGVKKAPFVVLIGANMPSILTEISFVTNPKDAAQLRQGTYRERIAESIYRGVARYANGLSGMRVAQNARPGAGGE